MFKNNPDELDQHFLIDKIVINNFIKVCNLNKEDVVLEIGPGDGTLTKLIAPKVKKMYVIEKDTRLKPYLDKIKNIDVTYGSCLDVPFPKVDKIITSLPYSIIEPFIYKVIHQDFNELYMIMGKNYCDNVINNKITNLSLLTNIYFDAYKYFDIYPDSFNPKPRVVSSLVKLTFKDKLNEKDMIFRNIYNLNDKLVKNALMESLIKVKGLTKRESKEYIGKLNLNAEILNKKFCMISNEELKKLYDKLM